MRVSAAGLCFLLAVATSVLPWMAVGQETPKKAAEGDALKEWAALQEKQKEIMAAAEKLYKQLQETKDEAARKELFGSLQKMQTDFYETVRPAMIKLAPQVLAKDPQNVTAAEVVAGQAFGENRYAEAMAIVDKILDGGKPSVALLTVGGVSHFAVHDFEKAREILTRA